MIVMLDYVYVFLHYIVCVPSDYTPSLFYNTVSRTLTAVL